MLAGELSAQLQIASADMERATDFARKGEYEATSDWLTTVATDLARADVAERAYNRALERRLAGESHTTGLSMALGLFGSIAKTNAIALPRNGWTPEIESDLSAMAYDLKLMANRLTKEIFIRADPGEVQSASQAVKRQFKTEAIR